MAHSQNTLTHTQYCDDTKGKTTLAGSWGQGWTAQNGRILGPGMDGSEWQGPGTRDGWLRMLPVSFYDISILVTQLEDVNQK